MSSTLPRFPMEQLRSYVLLSTAMPYDVFEGVPCLARTACGVHVLLERLATARKIITAWTFGSRMVEQEIVIGSRLY